MNIRSLLFSLLLGIVILNSDAIAQKSFTGRVTDVLDGRTLVIEDVSNQKFALQLAYLEIPAPEFPIWHTIKDHLRTLSLGKQVVYRVLSVEGNVNVARVSINGLDLNKQMIRDGAAWPHLVGLSYAEEAEYEAQGQAARVEKRGIWALEGLKTSLVLERERKEQAIEEQKKLAEKLAADEKIRRAEQRKAKLEAERKARTTVFYPALPSNLSKTKISPLNETIPKDYVVIGVGYGEAAPDVVVKLIKRAAEGDLACSGFPLPKGYVASMDAYSALCSRVGYGTNNAVALVSAKNYAIAQENTSNSITRDVLFKTQTAFRMYKVSGNWAEFESKANIAIQTVNQSIDYIRNEEIRSNLLFATEALRDAIIVRKSRSGNFGAGLSGSVLLALNDKYGLNDVAAILLDGAIMDVGRTYFNAAASEAIRLGIAKPR